jgi:TonB family protein
MLRKVLLPLITFILSASPLVGQAADGAIPDTSKGFDGQFKAVLNAMAANGQDAALLSLDEFKIPSTWFADTFGPENGAELEKKYGDEFKYFKFITMRKFGEYNLNKGSSVRTYSMKGFPKPKPTPEPPLKSIPKIQMYIVAGSNAQWMDSYIYVDGRFRFIGTGAHPFWDPAMVRRADPCAAPGSARGGKLIHRVEPTYPDEAQQRKVKGFVRMFVTVATDGSVKKIDIVDGNPLLVEAAKVAVMQWQYTPFMICGKPVEMQSSEHVKFPPDTP